jgi:hypothetical protein
MTNEKVSTLEQKVLSEQDFIAIYNYFMDHFGDHKAFGQLGERVLVPQLLDIFGQVGQAVLQKKEIRLEQPNIIKVQKWKMLHGFMQMEDRLLCFFYLKNINRGMISICKMGTSLVHYARITPQMLPDGTMPEGLFDDFHEMHAN